MVLARVSPDELLERAYVDDERLDACSLNVIEEDVLTGEMPAKAVSHEEHHL